MDNIFLMENLLLKEAIMFGVVFVCVAVLLFIIRRYFFRLIENLMARTDTTADDIVIATIKSPSIFWVLATALYVSLGSSNFPEKYVAYGLKALYILIIVSITIVTAGILSRGVRRRIETKGEGGGAGKQVTGLSKSVINVLVFGIGFLVILNSLGISITPMLTALGVGGLAVALALQDSLSNMFAGMHILVEKPLRVGDYIKLDSGEEGYVIDVGWRTTRIKKIENNIIVIPNNRVTQSIITNYNLPEPMMSLYTEVGVSYDSDPYRIEEILLEVASEAVGEVKGLLGEPAPEVRFDPGFGASSLDFTVVCKLRKYVDQYHVESELRKRIFKRLTKEGVEIPFPQRVVHMKKE
ncbi:MAG: mechanosensitive ion channel family protein [Thermodesulfobacteriota bacterium]